MKARVVISAERSVNVFFKHGLLLIDIKLGLEVVDVCRHVAAVGTATGIGELEVFIHHFGTGCAPVGLATAILLGLLGIGVGEPVLGKELGEVMFLVVVFKAIVLAVVELVRASHIVG